MAGVIALCRVDVSRMAQEGARVEYCSRHLCCFGKIKQKDKDKALWLLWLLSAMSKGRKEMMQ